MLPLVKRNNRYEEQKMKRIIRTVDELGRITLPHEIREALNLFPKKQVTLDLTDNGILVRKSEETPRNSNP